MMIMYSSSNAASLQIFIKCHVLTLLKQLFKYELSSLSNDE